MPSLQSYFFRVMTKVVSLRMNSITSIPKLRAFSEKISGSPLLPDGVTSHRLEVDGVSIEWIVPPRISSKSVILYLHGGAWVLGWYNNHRLLVAHIGQASQSRVLAVDYRLAPENPFPAALEDSLAAYRWLLKDGIEPNQIVIAGDSAGGNLALATLMALRQR
ncbi:MAG: alpha/beta hydrolase [Chloroflexi bacterium]|nr:alpha/beta hydrolase [Chloroflexota bacterium]